MSGPNEAIEEKPRPEVEYESQDSSTEAVETSPPPPPPPPPPPLLAEADDAGPPNGGLVAWLQVAAAFVLYGNTL